jgi:dolichyl-phosphate-mannose-protein mannosyltransferase
MDSLKKTSWLLLALIFFAVLIRIFIFVSVMSIPSNWDVGAYKSWALDSYSYGFSSLYKIDAPAQPPGAVYVMRGAYELYLQAAKTVIHFTGDKPGSVAWINDNLLIFFLRLPSLAADILLGLAIYYVVRKKTSQKLALFSSAFFLLNPGVLYNSAAWGQTDAINNLLFFLSIVCLLNRKIFLSALFLLFSFYFKLSLLPLLPLYFLLALSGIFCKRINFILAMVFSGLIIFLVNLPFSSNPFWLFESVTKISGGELQGITIYAFNFWWMLFAPGSPVIVPVASSSVFGLRLDILAYALFSLFIIPIFALAIALIKKKKLGVDWVFLLFALTAFAAFMFLPKMHERYLYPFLPLIAVWLGLKSKFWISAILISVIHFLNLYVVWNAIFIFGSFMEGIVRSQIAQWLCSVALLAMFVRFYKELLFQFPNEFKFLKNKRK